MSEIRRGGVSVLMAATTVVILLAAWTGVVVYVATYPAFPISPFLDAVPDPHSYDYGVRAPAAQVQLGLMVLIWIALCWWAYSARGSADQLSTRSHRFPRGWAVGVWLMPFANIVWPRQYLADLHHAYCTRDGQRSVLSYVWWTLWLGYLLSTPLSFLFGNTSLGEFLNGPAFWVWDVGVPVLSIGAAGSLALLVLRITWLRHTAERNRPSRASAAASGPPPGRR